MSVSRLGVCGAVALALVACTPKPSQDVRRAARQQVSKARSEGLPPLGVVTSPGAADHVFVCDPDGLISTAKEAGKNPAALYHFSEYEFDRACSRVEQGWYYCLVS
jgi:hypothetical protein